MVRILRTKDFRRHLLAIPSINFFHCHDGQDLVSGVGEGDFLTEADLIARFDGKRDWDWGQSAVYKAPIIDGHSVIFPTHEPVERRESGCGQ